MNASGDCVKPFVDYYNVKTSDILVIYDDIDIDKGGIRFRPHGSAGTHNGMRSIVERLDSEDFPRLRIGSKNTNPAIPLIDYVLMNIPAEEKAVILPALKKAADCAEDFAAGVEFDKLSCKYNARWILLLCPIFLSGLVFKKLKKPVYKSIIAVFLLKQR